jgi:uncharacterized protein YaiI (UPF0178 family)
MTTLYIDADACPVKDEVYRVAARYGLQVFVVCNSWIRVPPDPKITLMVVDAGPDVADDWIAERATKGDIVITADIPLAERSLRAGAQALSSKGVPFTPDNIGSALAGTCAPWAKSPAAPPPSPPPTAPASCRPSTRPS